MLDAIESAGGTRPLTKRIRLTSVMGQGTFNETITPMICRWLNKMRLIVLCVALVLTDFAPRNFRNIMPHKIPKPSSTKRNALPHAVPTSGHLAHSMEFVSTPSEE
jgi:hypothetical protein